MKKTEKKGLIEKMEFDSYAFAKSVFDESEAKIKRIKPGLIISAISSALSLAAVSFDGKNMTMFGILISIAFIGSIVSYIIGGGLKITLKATKKLALFGWFILPFPYDLATGLITLMIAPVAFFFLPVIFVYLNYKQVKNNRDEAEEYMCFCKPAEETESRVG